MSRSDDHSIPSSSSSDQSKPVWIKPLSDIEREAIETAIALCDGSVGRAAEALGVAPSTLYRKRQAWIKPD